MQSRDGSDRRAIQQCNVQPTDNKSPRVTPTQVSPLSSASEHHFSEALLRGSAGRSASRSERNYPTPKYGVRSGEQPPSPINGIGVVMPAHKVREGSKPSEAKEGSCGGGGGGGSSADAGVAKNNKPAVAAAAAAKIVRIIDRSYQLGGSLIITPARMLCRPNREDCHVLSDLAPRFGLQPERQRLKTQQLWAYEHRRPSRWGG
jgi:hypothetical protein